MAAFRAQKKDVGMVVSPGTTLRNDPVEVMGRKSMLASFLRARRARLTPSDVGLPREGPRRRLRGLRREEVAALADVSITWYTWLEQGRPIKIAPETLQRIADVLRLDDSEAHYLLKLAASHSQQLPPWDAPVPHLIEELVQSYTAGAAFVIGPRWDLLTFNRIAAALMGLRRDGAPRERNGLWLMFTSPATRELIPDWPLRARRAVSIFRAHYADYLGDAAFDDLIRDLTAASPFFAQLWSETDIVSPFASHSDHLVHRSAGLISYKSINLPIPDVPSLTLVFHLVDAEDGSRERLAELVRGTPP